MISIEQARVHWVKKTLEALESGEITIENPPSPLAPDVPDFPLSHTSRPLFFPLPPSNPCNKVSAISLSVILLLLCIFHTTTLPQSHLVNSPEADMEHRPEDRAIEENVKEVSEADMERRPEDRAVEEGVKEVLALSQANRPKNTRRCYLPKQKEWKASLFPSNLLLFYDLSFYFISFFYIVPLLICLQGWCKRMAFRPGGEYLPYDWVETR